MTQQNLLAHLAQHSADLQAALSDPVDFHKQIIDVAVQFREAFNKGNKVLVAGNGGSAAEAQHLSDEMVGKYNSDRPAYPVIALTTDGAILTCIGNDYGYENVFARQVDALGSEGDIFVGLSTSGNSPNILAAAEKAREKGLTIIAFTARKGKLREMADFAIDPPTDINPRAQELHLHAIHLLCELFEPAQAGMLLN